MIPPTLTSEQWQSLHAKHSSEYSSSAFSAAVAGVRATLPVELPQIIAVANHQLPDDDPRKITWAMVDDLRAWSAAVGDRWRSDTTVIDQTAEALASYLPPREEHP
jgi:hypothetical protein